MPEGRPIRTDPTAESASDTQPAFVARPAGAAVYHGFAVLESSQTDGWSLGVISDPSNSATADYLDGFVVAPDGSRAGLIWDRGATEIAEVLGPSPGRWGVYSIPLPRHVGGEDELIAEFRRVLPALNALWIKAHDA